MAGCEGKVLCLKGHLRDLHPQMPTWEVEMVCANVTKIKHQKNKGNKAQKNIGQRPDNHLICVHHFNKRSDDFINAHQLAKKLEVDSDDIGVDIDTDALSNMISNFSEYLESASGKSHKNASGSHSSRHHADVSIQYKGAQEIGISGTKRRAIGKIH